MFLLDQVVDLGTPKSENCRLNCIKLIITVEVTHQYNHGNSTLHLQTDRRTDRQADRQHCVAIQGFALRAFRGKNGKSSFTRRMLDILINASKR